MGDGWADVWRPAVWQAVAGTRFGGVWIRQILLALTALAVVWIRPHHGASATDGPAGGPAAAFRRGWACCYARWLYSAPCSDTNHAVHLFCVASWFGGLLPFIYCLRLAQGRWRQAAVYTMARFSRYGHLAVRRHTCQRSGQSRC
ncbi:hypothetical protein LNO81_18480 [Klebsiella variicola subsp. variicola]|nr:hypothetical protein [Klebsiella variicola subsp. variicola]